MDGFQDNPFNKILWHVSIVPEGGGKVVTLGVVFGVGSCEGNLLNCKQIEARFNQFERS